MSKRSFAEGIEAIVNRKGADGRLKYTSADVHALRAMLLLELARQNLVEDLSESSKAELALTLELIGIGELTPPDQVLPLIVKYYQSMEINPDIFIELNDMLLMLGQQKDRVEGIDDSSKAYDKMMQREGPTAPSHDADVPEDAEKAQTFTLNLGGKVRI